jgi:putative flippase GtrA
MRRPGSLAKAINSKEGRSSARYLAVVLGGFVIDLSIAWASHELLGVPLIAAAALGFAVALSLSYFAHEFWTFERQASAVSARRFVKFVLAAGATLGTRLILVWATGLLVGLPGGSLARLLIAYGGSLIVGFMVNRGVVFTDDPDPEAAEREKR